MSGYDESRVLDLREKYEAMMIRRKGLETEIRRRVLEESQYMLTEVAVYAKQCIEEYGVPVGKVKTATRKTDHSKYLEFMALAGGAPEVGRGSKPKAGTYVRATGSRAAWEIHDNRALILPSDDWNLENEWWDLEAILFGSGKEVWVTHWDSTYAPITLTIAWDKYGFESLSKLQDGGEEWQEFSNAIVLFFKNNPDVKKELMKKLAVEK